MVIESKCEKKVYNNEKMIRYDDVIEKLVISKLRCYYCRKDCLLMCKYKGDESMDIR